MKPLHIIPFCWSEENSLVDAVLSWCSQRLDAAAHKVGSACGCSQTPLAYRQQAHSSVTELQTQAANLEILIFNQGMHVHSRQQGLPKKTNWFAAQQPRPPGPPPAPPPPPAPASALPLPHPFCLASAHSAAA